MGNTPTTPDVSFKMAAEGDASIVAALRHLSGELRNVKREQQETAKSSLNLKTAFQAIVASAVVAKLVQVGRETFQSAIAIGKMQEASGLSARTLSVMAQAADHLGVSEESLHKGAVKAAKSIFDLESGSSKAAKSFGMLGLSAKDFAGLNPDQKLRKVIDALGGMKDSGEKAAIAQEIFGKGSKDLIPALNRLAGEGFDQVAAGAEKFGQILDDNTVASAMAAAGAMDSVGDAADGVAKQIMGGLLPGLADAADALTDATTGQGVSGFQKVGEVAGNVVRLIVFGFEFVGKTIGAVAAGIVEQFSAVWDTVKLGASTIFEAFGAAASGEFSRAWGILTQGGRDAVARSEEYSAKMRGIYGQLGSDIKENFLDLFDPDRQAARQAKRIADAKSKTGQGSDAPEITPKDDAASNARLSFLRQQLENELSLFRANAKQKEELDRDLYERGEISFVEHLRRKRAAIDADLEKEIATLEAEKRLAAQESVDNPAQAIAQQQRLADLDAKLERARVEAATKKQSLDQEEFKAREDHSKRVLDFQTQILEAQGRTFDAAIARIKQESEEIRRALVQAGLSPDKVAELTSQLEAAKTSAAQLEEQKRQSSLEMGALDLDRQQLELDIASGRVLEIDRERKLAEIESRRLETLRAIAAAMYDAAQKTGDQAAIQEAEQFRQQVEGIAISADYAGQQWAKFKNSAIDAAGSSLQNFFTTGIQNAKGLGDAFRGLASSAIDSLRQIAAQMLSNLLMQKMMGSLGGFGKMFGFSDGGLVGAKFADGGLVLGAGTATSDSIPARLSNGEFVMRAAAVRAVGVDFLAAINRGLNIPAIRGTSIPRFAEGGLVRADGERSAMDLRLGLSLDRGIIIEELSSKSAGSVILEQLGNNSKGANKALGRG